MADPQRSNAVRIDLPLGIMLFTAALYFTSLGNPLLLDDRTSLAANGLQDDPNALVSLWTQPYRDGAGGDPNLYRPVTVLTYYLGQRLLNDEPASLRFINILCLSIVGWFTAWWFGRYIHPLGAWLGAMLLVAHPVNAAMINQVVGRADLLAMMGVVGFLLTQRRAFAEGRWSLLLMASGLVFAAIAYGSKETGLLLAPTMLAQAWVLSGRKPIPRLTTDAAGQAITPSKSPTQRGDRSQLGLVWIGIALMAVPLAVYFAGRVEAVGLWTSYYPGPDDITGNPLRGLPPEQRIAPSLSIAWFYFRQVFWPDASIVLTPIDLPGWTSPSVYLGAMVVVISIVLWVNALIKRQWVAIPLTLALGQYALVGQLFCPTGMYVSNALTLPFLLSAAAMAARLVEHYTASSARRRAIAVIVCTSLAVTMLMGVQWANAAWGQPIRQLNAELAATPGHPVIAFRKAQAHRDRARRVDEPQRRETQLKRAVEQLRSVLAARPGSIQAQLALWRVYRLMGRNEDAMRMNPALFARLNAYLDRYPGDDRTRRLRAQFVREVESLQDLPQSTVNDAQDSSAQSN